MFLDIDVDGKPGFRETTDAADFELYKLDEGERADVFANGPVSRVPR